MKNHLIYKEKISVFLLIINYKKIEKIYRFSEIAKCYILYLRKLKKRILNFKSVMLIVITEVKKLKELVNNVKENFIINKRKTFMNYLCELINSIINLYIKNYKS
jgi:hypothetical protein